MFSKVKIIFSLFLIVIAVSNKCLAQTTPPTLAATDSLAYCPTSQIYIAPSFNISNPDNIEIHKIYIQISEGYDDDNDILEYNGSIPNITAEPFDKDTGKLVLVWNGTGSQNDADNALILAVTNVIFENSSVTISSSRKFSITIDEKNYLPSTGHYYEYISSPGITWTSAKVAAENLPPYYGVLTPYLATITSAEEAQLSGEQAAGAGWIGGSDAAVEGTWRWVTGPEGLNGGMIFWNGLANGSNPPGVYSNWNIGEPNQYNGANEDYAHVTAPGVGITGSWNDLTINGDEDSNSDYHPKGYIVEYGGMPGNPTLNISASTTIYIPEIIDSSTPTPICGSGITVLTAISNTGFVIWFDAPTGGNKLGNGDTYTTPNISTTTSYYALASSDGICETGLRTKIDVLVNTIPTITSVSPPITICGAGVATLTASASAGTVNWFDSQTGGSSIKTGNSFTTPVTTTNTVYYVDATSNNCTTVTRTPVYLNVQYTIPPTTTESTQTFCDIENATLSTLNITGNNILWYTTETGGPALPDTTLLVDNTTYYASQTENTCESPTRLPIAVKIYETVVPLLPADIPLIEDCDSTVSGDDTDGFTTFDLTQNEAVLLNGKDAADFSFSYFTEANYLATTEISNPTNFQNTIQIGQPIYVRISNNLDPTCLTETSFNIQVNELPIIQPAVTLKNCDEDGTPDGFTDFNLTEADPFITNGDTSLTVSYYLTFSEADNGNGTPLNPSPFNNLNAINNEVFARVSNTNNCYRVSTVSLAVSATSFDPTYMAHLETCDNDDTIDGSETFDLTQASTDIINQFPTGQNLSVHYFRDSNDAQLSENEILPQDSYVNETPYSQILYVRVQSEDNGDCFGVGPHLTLTVDPRPEFEIEAVPNEIVCLNLPPITLRPYNEQGIYNYEWFDEAGLSIGTDSYLDVSTGGIYTAIASSPLNCVSFPQTITITESDIATITLDDISITDDSDNNTITIDTTNLGIGDYEFSLDEIYGPYQDEPIFTMVPAGIHTIYIQDKNNCGTVSINVSVLGFPNFFTPNNDGINDTWEVKGLSQDFYSAAIIYIFDRFGKLITQVDPNSNGWKGLYNGKELPPTDYWFTAQLTDNDGNIRERKGHFSLIRN